MTDSRLGAKPACAQQQSTLGAQSFGAAGRASPTTAPATTPSLAHSLPGMSRETLQNQIATQRRPSPGRALFSVIRNNQLDAEEISDNVLDSFMSRVSSLIKRLMKWLGDVLKRLERRLLGRLEQQRPAPLLNVRKDADADAPEGEAAPVTVHRKL